ncbi:hypothetical protein Bxe_A4329 [Paraburkholderia xenovorans LB400]|uniref:Uncharacterized protein n=1 Tax=Paraburkholderia xenovorans (strain LB400) TaxID=266265 RepID=Q146R8_PARXL|nr:hypothetical protein Bxe_A4329 [Paraburkholderia xenovorans LB400]
MTRARLREVGLNECPRPGYLKRGGQFAIKRNALQSGSKRRKSRKTIETFSIIHFSGAEHLGTVQRIGSPVRRAHWRKRNPS